MTTIGKLRFGKFGKRLNRQILNTANFEHGKLTKCTVGQLRGIKAYFHFQVIMIPFLIAQVNPDFLLN